MDGGSGSGCGLDGRGIVLAVVAAGIGGVAQPWRLRGACW